MLEHVSKEAGFAYLHQIVSHYKISSSQILDLCRPISNIGGPELVDFGLGEKISPTALRYLKVALEIRDMNGSSLGNVVEIGCGYGGQSLLLSALCKIESYLFVDMWQVNLLIQRFIESSNFNVPYSLKTIRQVSPRAEFDLAISNYAFSEFNTELQAICLRNILAKSHAGYLTMNHGKVDDEGGTCIPASIIQSILSKVTLSEEKPLTGLNNYLLHW